MPQSSEFRLPTSSLSARFDGPQLTSDGGLVWLAEADAALGLCTRLAAAIPEWRTGFIQHSRPDELRPLHFRRFYNELSISKNLRVRRCTRFT